MAEIKTKATKESVKDFLDKVEPKEKREDCLVLLKMFQEITGENPILWSNSIVGFGTYHYKSERSKQEGDWMKVGFSPRKQNLTLYILTWTKDEPLLEKLGKHKRGGGCLYINHLADVDMEILEELIKKSYDDSKKMNK